MQSKLTLMSESLRNDGRVWVPKQKGDLRPPTQIPEDERNYYLEERYPAFGNLVPRDIASRAAKKVCDEGYGVGTSGYAVYLDFAEAIGRLGQEKVSDRYGNLFAMYEEISADDPYQTPMMIYPAPHYTMGGLWVDYMLMSTIPGLHVLGEANFSDHGANRLGASALMQGLADGYFVIPNTIGVYVAGERLQPVSTDHEAFRESEDGLRQQIDAFLACKGAKTVRQYHSELGRILWDNVGMSRNRKGLEKAIDHIRELREEYHENVNVPGSSDDLNKSLEMAGRVADFFELGELMARDAALREESCGGHFREEYQTSDGEALRDDANFTHVAAWEFHGEDKDPERHQEELNFEVAELKQRSYK
jgi:succinate dehydrogenase / fumarate reductase flavoprotein subunit